MQTKTLGEICRPKQWKTVATSQLSEEGYPVYGANGIIGKYKEYNHENETILVTCRGATCGALNICEPFSYVNGNAMALDNLDQSIDLKYLYYFLKGRGFHDVISGSAQPQIIRSAIERIEVPICDIETQKEITKSFAKIEKLIESKKKILANLDNLVKARFVEMF
ncbi:restriction endonuclease subunit S, partial [Candidatus Saccharibacteria bacterium]|nr:restriction endonuclease subunit S [Candidatus Saccharibacteria bacterium]